MKKLILMRHAHALGCFTSQAATDRDRPLSEQGGEKAALSAHEIKHMGHLPQLILTSPLLRAQQTAQLAADILNAPLQIAEELSGRLSARDLCQFLAAQMKEKDCLLVVGHNPNIALVYELFCKQEAPFAPGTFAVLDFTNPHKPQSVFLGE